MSTLPSFAFPDAGDQMDVASSPYRPPDDIDIDLHSVRDASLAGSPAMIDLMEPDPADRDLSVLGDLPEDLGSDDELMNEANPEINAEDFDIDYSMEPVAEDVKNDEDEDILYEDDDYTDVAAGTTGIPTDTVPEQPQEPQEQPQEQEREELDLATQAAQADQEVNYDISAADILEDESAFQPEAEHTNPQETTANDEFKSDPYANDQAAAEEVSQHQDPQGDAPHLETAHFTFLEETSVAPLPAETQQQPPTDATTNSGEPSNEDELAREGDLYLEEETTAHEAAAAAADQDNAQASDQSWQHAHDQPADIEAPRQTSSQSIHPVTLVYLGEEMSLFPPSVDESSATYFLSDPSLAFETLDRLLAACRELLAGTLEHDDELVLDVTALGLHISEDSKYTSQITLSQILEVYLNLCHNDEGSETHPLYCNLSSRVSLASQYAYLTNVCAEGRTFAEIAAENIDTPLDESSGQDPSYSQDPSGQIAVGDEDAENPVGDGEPNDDDTAAPEVEVDDSRPSPVEESSADLHIASETSPPDASEDLQDDANVGPTSPNQHPAEIDPIHPLGDGAADIEEEPVHHDDENENLLDDQAGQAVATSAVDEEHFTLPRDDLDQGLITELYQSGQQVPVDTDDVHEADTSSSHTLEAENPEAVELDFGNGEVGVGAEQYESHTLPQNEENLFGDGDPQQDDDDDYTHVEEAYDEDELLIGDDDFNNEDIGEQTANDDLSSHPQQEEAQADFNQQANGHLQASATASPPITPSKAASGKRKIEFDDELDLIDFSTPEPKRRRPS